MYLVSIVKRHNREIKEKGRSMITKKVMMLSAVAVLCSSALYGGELERFNNANVSKLSEFTIENSRANNYQMLSSDSVVKENMLKPTTHREKGNIRYQRMQQYYKGIEVVGAEVIVTEAVNNASGNTQMLALNNASTKVNGVIVRNLNVDTAANISKEDAIKEAISNYQRTANGYVIDDSKENAPLAKLQIISDKKADRLAYLVSFSASHVSQAPQKMRYYIDAKTGSVINYWNNLQYFEDRGPGGNEKVKQYFYGEGGMPYLDVAREGIICTMNNPRVRAVNLEQNYSEYKTSAYRYLCRQNYGEYVNGSYSSLNDAYYFGELIIDMYKNWYNLDALFDSQTQKPMQLIMRVHYGQEYENAFWNGENMTFGDGKDRFYPLVSLDVAGHEVSHGFTEQNSSLVYANESGALNEAFSDMSGQAVRAYLLNLDEAAYQKLYPYDKSGKIGWGLGETITKGKKHDALRYMNKPSKDGGSADCYDKAIAGEKCKITYDDVVVAAKKAYPTDLSRQQSYIVHKASGIYNKAFYLLSVKWGKNHQEKDPNNMLSNAYVEGVKEAFAVMVQANLAYWTPNITMDYAACDVIKATEDLGYSQQDVKKVFKKVGVSTAQC